MKKLLIVLFSVGLALGASAQKVRVVPRAYPVVRPHVVVTTGFYSPFYSPFYYPYFGYPYYGYPPGYYGYNRPTRLDMQIQDIKNDYQARISSVKLDNSLTRKERREKIRELKSERDHDVSQAKIDYYKTPRNNNYRDNRNNDNDSQGSN